MKHTITLDLQQITDLDVIRVDLINRAGTFYARANNKILSPYFTENKREADRLMAQATLINSILSQIKKNG